MSETEYYVLASLIWGFALWQVVGIINLGREDPATGSASRPPRE